MALDINLRESVFKAQKSVGIGEVSALVKQPRTQPRNRFRFVGWQKFADLVTKSVRAEVVD